jgi:hypothetical protein
LSNVQGPVAEKFLAQADQIAATEEKICQNLTDEVIEKAIFTSRLDLLQGLMPFQLVFCD